MTEKTTTAKKAEKAGGGGVKPGARRPARQKHEGIAEALAAFQAEMPVVGRNSTGEASDDDGTSRTYSYADLASITEAAMPLLTKHGLSFTAAPTLDPEHGFVLQYMLMHTSGEGNGGVYPLPGPNSTEHQRGSAITYARRYALCSVAGIAVASEDDDATAAVARNRPSGAPAAQRSAQAQQAVQTAQQWLDAIGGAQSFDDLNAVYQQANSRGQASQQVMQALSKRKGELSNGAHPAESVPAPAAVQRPGIEQPAE